MRKRSARTPTACNDAPVEDLTEDEAALWRSWKTATESVRAKIAKDVREATGLPEVDFSILSWVVDVGGGELSGSAVEKALGLSRTYLLHRLDGMVAAGLLNQAGGAGRDVWIRATVDGRAVLGRARPAHAAAVRRHLLDHLTDGADAPTFRVALARLAKG